MGLSPGKGKKKVEAQEATTTAAINNVSTVDPLDAKIRAKAQRFMDWEDSTQPKNILDAPGISDQMDIYGEAQGLADQEMMGSGAGQLANPSSGAYQDQVKQLSANQRYDTRAAGLSNALQGLKAEAYGAADSSINRDFERKMASAQLNQGQLSQYYNRYKVQNPWYQKLFNAGNQVGRTAASAMTAYGSMGG